MEMEILWLLNPLNNAVDHISSIPMFQRDLMSFLCAEFICDTTIILIPQLFSVIKNIEENWTRKFTRK